ncbi:OadG family protein [uncultured Veillonella sp.]|uniref:methylmalonyl-CoA decarboxylase subunit delta n=1 Tax=uncultured Veillonella sp. TaxID=159268 RepID=UPI0025D13A84|nr:OadG family protein [uncultured Veillonella sp.]
MEGQAVTTNPLLIMAINMSIVFFVLIALGILMKIVYLIDPTKKKKEAPKTDTTVAASAASAAPAAPAVAAPSASAQNEDEVVAAIVGAIVAMGYSSEQIASIRPTATSAKWRLEGRLSGRG